MSPGGVGRWSGTDIRANRIASLHGRQRQWDTAAALERIGY
jgi:hypothetical protein